MTGVKWSRDEPMVMCGSPPSKRVRGTIAWECHNCHLTGSLRAGKEKEPPVCPRCNKLLTYAFTPDDDEPSIARCWLEGIVGLALAALLIVVLVLLLLVE